MTKLNSLKNYSARLSTACFLLLGILFFSGCTGKPFGSAVNQDLRPSLESKYNQFATAAAVCPSSFDGEIIINWKHSLKTISFSGFFQTMLPSSFRLSVLNPLGQPLFAAASNGKFFQAVDTTKKIFTTGRLRSYALLHDISDSFISGEWGLWLAGRPPAETLAVTEIYNDPEGKGIWFVVKDPVSNESPREYILLDVNGNKMLERVILGKKGTMEATITYNKWRVLDECLQPQEISITGLSFGAEAQLSLSDLQKAELTSENFKIPVPPNYLRNILP